MKTLKNKKAQFINNEIWVLTFAGGFQRAGVYQKSNDSDAAKENKRTLFRFSLREKIEELVNEQYTYKIVSSEAHCNNIENLVKFSQKYGENHKGLLTNDKINIGITQKLLNLYLKYLWSLGEIPTPPHFPVDRIIQEKLIKGLKEKKLNTFILKPWTQFNKISAYKTVINYAENLLNEHQCNTLAELELELFGRR